MNIKDIYYTTSTHINLYAYIFLGAIKYWITTYDSIIKDSISLGIVTYDMSLIVVIESKRIGNCLRGTVSYAWKTVRIFGTCLLHTNYISIHGTYNCYCVIYRLVFIHTSSPDIVLHDTQHYFIVIISSSIGFKSN